MVRPTLLRDKQEKLTKGDKGIGRILTKVQMAHLETGLLLACLYLLCCSTKSEFTKAHFPYYPEAGKFPRLKIESSFSSLSSFTLCQWVKPNFDHREIAFFNYGVPGQDKEILLTLEDKSVRFYVGGRLLINGSCNGQFLVEWISGAWHHICVTWNRNYRNIKYFVNGIHCASASESLDHRIPGKGIMVLGQALKGLDTDFHKNNSWSGDITEVQMWDEVLTYQQILRQGRCKRKLGGNVVSWMKTPVVASDEVILSTADVCDVLDKTSD